MGLVWQLNGVSASFQKVQEQGGVRLPSPESGNPDSVIRGLRVTILLLQMKFGISL